MKILCVYTNANLSLVIRRFWSLMDYFCVFAFPVCDDTCREAVMDHTNELLVCTISGHCFDMVLSPAEMEPDPVSKSFLQLTVICHKTSCHQVSNSTPILRILLCLYQNFERIYSIFV